MPHPARRRLRSALDFPRRALSRPWPTMLLALLLVLAIVPPARAWSPSPPVGFDLDEIRSIRAGVQAGDPTLMPAYERLLRAADALLPMAPASVMDKKLTAPSGDRHDFYAIGNYSWPDPDRPDGLPYIRRDGHKNPGARGPDYDKGAFNTTVDRIETLALAYFFSGNEAYAAKSADLLRAWFLDPATRMNPNLRYAAAQPGVTEGHYGGIIEGVVLIDMLDHVRLLESAQSWTSADAAALGAWFDAFTTWLLDSEFGREEIESTNNHGTWYAAQVAAFARYAGQDDRVRRMMELARHHLARQVAADGSLPKETARSNSFMYSVYGLRPFAVLARCGEAVGEDLWAYTAPNGRNLSQAFHFLAPYLAEERAWPGPRIDPGIDHYALGLFRQAAAVYGTAPLVAAAAHLADLRSADDRSRLLGRTPELQPALDDFEDYPAEMALDGRAGGGGWVGAWSGTADVRVTATSITYRLGSRTLGGGNALMAAAGGGFARKLLPRPDRSGRPYFMSFLVRIAADPRPRPPGSPPPLAIAPAGRRIAAAGLLPGQPAATGLAGLVPDRTQFVVIGYGGWDGDAYRTADVWIDPSPGQDAAGPPMTLDAADLAGGAGTAGFAGLFMRTASIGRSAAFLFDDVRIGRSWDDVVPGAMAAAHAADGS